MLGVRFRVSFSKMRGAVLGVRFRVSFSKM